MCMLIFKLHWLHSLPFSWSIPDIVSNDHWLWPLGLLSGLLSTAHCFHFKSVRWYFDHYDFVTYLEIRQCEMKDINLFLPGIVLTYWFCGPMQTYVSLMLFLWNHGIESLINFTESAYNFRQDRYLNKINTPSYKYLSINLYLPLLFHKDCICFGTQVFCFLN